MEPPDPQLSQLQSRIELLEEENAQLSERAEETLLLGLVGETIGRLDESGEILVQALERISILKDIPLCACLALENKTARVVASYAAFSNESPLALQVELSAPLREALEAGPVSRCLSELGDKEVELLLTTSSFNPRAVALVAFGSRSIPAGAFLFVDDDPGCERLTPMLSLLERVAEVAVGRMDRVELLRELQQTNDELDNKVLERTRELERANERLREDAHEQAMLEAQLRQSQKMEAVGNLAGGIAHDFNNLLQVIIGSATLAECDAAQGAPVEESLAEILRAGDRAAALVRQLLLFSRREKMVPRSLDLGEVVGELAKMLRRLLGERVELTVICPSRLPRVLADLNQMEQVFLNLCINARDAMPSGGAITIHLQKASIDDAAAPRWSVPPGDYVIVSVSDTGTGIPQGVIEHIFEPFFTTKEHGHGTGLGLATVYGIVQRHHGQISVSSPPGRGATFEVVFPVDSTRCEDEFVSVSEPPLPGGDEVILLAEDDEQVRALAARVLEGAGYRVLLAGDGAEAIELFDQHGEEIDLCLLDVIMPKVNGHAVQQHVQSRSPMIPVLFSSGYTNDAAASDGFPGKGNELIHKPYRPGDLLRHVRQVLDAPMP